MHRVCPRSIYIVYRLLHLHCLRHRDLQPQQRLHRLHAVWDWKVCQRAGLCSRLCVVWIWILLQCHWFEYLHSVWPRTIQHSHRRQYVRVLSNWKTALPKFVRVLPKDYERMLEAFKEVEASGLSGDDAVMAAFEINKNDRSRVSGN